MQFKKMVHFFSNFCSVIGDQVMSLRGQSVVDPSAKQDPLRNFDHVLGNSAILSSIRATSQLF